MQAISNSSPLIYLGKIGALDLFKNQFSSIFTTDYVRDEILADTNAPEHLALLNAFDTFLTVRNLANTRFFNLLIKMAIHPGEASVIALAREFQQEKKISPMLILDDLMAREICESLNIKMTGTLGIILHAVKHAQITVQECKTYFRNLCENTTFRIETRLYSRILAEIE